MNLSHISLPVLAQYLHGQAEESPDGCAVHVVKDDGVLRQLAILLLAGGTLSEHDNPGEAMLLVVSGSVQFRVEDERRELLPGDLLRVPEERHSVEADEESLLLLSFAAQR